MIVDKFPDQLKLAYALWTRKVVQELIEQDGDADPCCGRVSKALGNAPQKPAKRAYEQNPQAMAKWLESDYPQIKLLAKRD